MWTLIRYEERSREPRPYENWTTERGVAPLGLRTWGYAGAINIPPRWGCGSFRCDGFGNEKTVRYNKRAREPRPYEEFLMRITLVRYNRYLLKFRRDDTFIAAQVSKRLSPSGATQRSFVV